MCAIATAIAGYQSDYRAYNAYPYYRGRDYRDAYGYDRPYSYGYDGYGYEGYGYGYNPGYGYQKVCDRYGYCHWVRFSYH